jgi:Domain of unknown function (DUF4188)
MIRSERLTSTFEGKFVVFLIGLRINNPLLVHKWWPVTRAMPRMLEELNRQPELGFLHAEETRLLSTFQRGTPSTKPWVTTVQSGSGTKPTLRRLEPTKTCTSTCLRLVSVRLAHCIPPQAACSQRLAG